MRILSISVLVALSMAFVGCKSLEQKVEEKLGIPVQVMAENNDSCAYSQLRLLYKDFKKMGEIQQQQVAADLRSKVKSIVIEPTRVGQVIQGTLVTLTYSNGEYGVGQKTLFDDRTYQGESPVTRISNQNQILNIRTETVRDEVLLRRYVTYYLNVYDQIESVSDPLFNASRMSGQIYLRDENGLVGIKCGKRVSLGDLLSSL